MTAYFFFPLLCEILSKAYKDKILHIVCFTETVGQFENIKGFITHVNIKTIMNQGL